MPTAKQLFQLNTMINQKKEANASFFHVLFS